MEHRGIGQTSNCLGDVRDNTISIRSLYNPTAERNLGKIGEPRPVTGSQPCVALKPCVAHPGLFPASTERISSTFQPEHYCFNHTFSNILQRRYPLIGVQKRIQEPEDWPPSSDKLIIQQCNDARESRRRGAGARYTLRLAANLNSIIYAERGDVGYPAS